MKYRHIILFVLAACGLLGPATADANQMRGITEVYPVSAAAASGVDTGFAAKPQAPVTVRAFGSACPFGTTFCADPDGAPGTPAAGSFLLPGAPAWGLIARAGSGPWTAVGAGPTAFAGSGNVVFAVNDDAFANNTGGFVVLLSYDCYPGNGRGDPGHYHCGPPGQS